MRLCEKVFLNAAPRIDAEKGILYGIKLLGRESSNNRIYGRQVMEAAVPLYTGKKIYIDHPQGPRGGTPDRSVERWAGTIQNARYENEGVYGDIKLRKKSPFFEGILEAATEFPKDVGFSHIADGETRLEGDTEIVESIREVFSVDLVTDPATTAGMYESKRSKRTIKQAVESLPEGTARTHLIEMMDGGYIDGSMSMNEPEKTDPQTQIMTAFQAVLDVVLEVLRSQMATKQEPPVAEVDPEVEPEEEIPVEKKPEEEEALAFESMRWKVAELEAKTLLLESGREASPVRVKALAATAEAERAELLESWPITKTQSGERPLRSPPLVEADYSFDVPRGDSERFAALLR